MGHPQSLFLTQLLRTPIHWSSQQPWYRNLLNHLQTVYHRGADQVSRRYEDDRMKTNLDPVYRYKRLSDDLAGENPVIKNPWDRVLAHGPRAF